MAKKIIIKKGLKKDPARRELKHQGFKKKDLKKELKKKEIKKKYRYVFKHAIGKKGIKDYMVAWFPECYFLMRKAILK